MNNTLFRTVESIANINSLLATLRDIKPVLDTSGRPVNWYVHGINIFEIKYQGRRAYLCCAPEQEQLLRNKYQRYAELSSVAPEFFGDIIYREQELSVWDSYDRVHHTSVIIIPHNIEWMNAERFITYAYNTSNFSILHTALHNFVSLVTRLDAAGKSYDLAVLFDSTGRLVVSDTLLRSDRSLVTAAILASGICMINHQEPHLQDPHIIAEGMTRLCRRLGIGGLTNVAKCAALWDMCRIDPEGLRIAIEECWKLSPATDLTPTPHKVSEREGIRLVVDDDGYYYIDSEERELGVHRFQDAEPMREGRAEVATHQGRGLLDNRGDWVLPPIYEELVWDEHTGTCTVMHHGKWEIFDREGVLLTDRCYDWIGTPHNGVFEAELDGQTYIIDNHRKTK